MKSQVAHEPSADTDEPFTWPPAFDHLIRESQAWLAERGKTIIGSGCFRSGQLSGSVHTDFGPEDQDKDANQDYALAWLPHDEQTQKRFRFVLALGDGLTTSFRSEWASALVCSVALRALVEGDPGLQPKDLARYAFNEAGRSLGRLADELTARTRSVVSARPIRLHLEVHLEEGGVVPEHLDARLAGPAFLPRRHGRRRRGRVAQ